MKICSKCKEAKEFKFFRKKGTGYQSYCDPCLYAHQMHRWILRKQKAVKYKGGKCESCGYHSNYAALHFHHKDPKDKLFVWTKLRLRPWNDILTELDKCSLLCANCHTEFHHPSQMVGLPGIEPRSVV